jgi:hypothetical protein
MQRILNQTALPGLFLRVSIPHFRSGSHQYSELPFTSAHQRELVHRPQTLAKAIRAVSVARRYDDANTWLGLFPANHVPNAIDWASPQVGQRNVHVTCGEVEHLAARYVGVVVGDIPRTLCMSDQIDPTRMTDGSGFRRDALPSSRIHRSL